MFKRVEKRRRKREEEEELGLDEDAKELLGLHDTDSAESDTGSESDSQADDGEELVEGAEAVEGDDESEPGDADEESPITVEEALKDPIYLISLEPTVHGCILCKSKIIKNAQMATLHRNSTAHKRRYERFKPLASAAAPSSNAWDIVNVLVRDQDGGKECQSSDQLSKRALKRQAKQATLREKRKRHKELKVKAMNKKAEKKALKTDASVPSSVIKDSEPQSEPSPSKRPAKRPKLEQKRPNISKSTNTKPALRTKGNKKSQREHRRKVDDT